MLVHAAPGKAKIEILAAADRAVARGDLDRHGEYSPMTLVERDGSTLYRSEVQLGVAGPHTSVSAMSSHPRRPGADRN